MVLSLVSKTEMEDTFRNIIPEDERYGSTFVFRQGNPLLPDDLRVVAASSAAATVLVSDTSRFAHFTPSHPAIKRSHGFICSHLSKGQLLRILSGKAC